ncbi:USP8 [Symbiodinium necroappetens]|uniref:USP8 protein n=1 Tax=Symbiodinium necroappetens TaxID=1628268 RepID=A0A813BSG9_9DINO|nr:USP8 [Symbiodinium necroappetens]
MSRISTQRSAPPPAAGRRGRLLEVHLEEIFVNARSSVLQPPHPGIDCCYFCGGAGLELLHQATTYRGFHADDPRGCAEVDAVIRAMQEVANVSRIVVGHTPDAEVRIRCRERLIAADSALSRYYRAYGNRYCPIKTDAQRLANTGCSTPVSAECDGQAQGSPAPPTGSHFKTLPLQTPR